MKTLAIDQQKLDNIKAVIKWIESVPQIEGFYPGDRCFEHTWDFQNEQLADDIPEGWYVSEPFELLENGDLFVFLTHEDGEFDDEEYQIVAK